MVDLQNWHRVVLEIVNLFRPRRLLEVGRATPAVVIEGEEINTRIVSATVHVFGSLHSISICFRLEPVVPMSTRASHSPMSAAE